MGQQVQSIETRAVPYALRAKVAERAAIGILALAEDATIESEWRYLIDIAGVRFFTGRVDCAPEISPHSLLAMKDDLATATRQLVPGSALDVMAYACTSASLMISEEVVVQAIRKARPQILVTTPLTAAKAALTAVNARTVVLLTPYVDAINRPLRTHLESAGFEVRAMASFFNSNDPEVMRIDEQSIAAAVGNLLRDTPADAAFVACTSLGGARSIPTLEANCGSVITTSNHAMAWHALRLAGVIDKLPQHGRLFAT